MSRCPFLFTSQVRHGFTLVEVCLLLLVVSLGLFGVIGLVGYGTIIAARAQGETTGLATAVTVANDPTPLLAAARAGDWRFTPYNMDGTGNLTSTANGYINGFYVVRTERSGDADVVARDPLTNLVHVRSAVVEVEVYGSANGNPVASFTTRINRQRGVR